MRNITIPEGLIDKVIEELKAKHDDQQLYYSQSISSVRKEYEEIDKSLSNGSTNL